MPLISQPLVPDAAAPGGPDLTLTLSGTGFAQGATVNWNGTPLATMFANASQLTATVPAANLVTPGTASVAVANPGVEASNIAPFSVTNVGSLVAFSRTDYATSGGQQAVAVGDFNGDGVPDLAITVRLGLLVLLAKGDGTFEPPVSYAYGSGQKPLAIVAADFNGDGILDLAFSLTLRTSTVAISLEGMATAVSSPQPSSPSVPSLSQ